MNFVGALFLVSVDASVLKRILGVFFLVFSVQRYFQLLRLLRQRSTPPATNKSIPAASTVTPQQIEVQPVNDASMQYANDSPAGREFACTPEYFQGALKRFLHGGWRGFLPKTRNLMIAGFVAGLLAGFLNGSFGTGGPPLMIFFTYIDDLEKDQIRATTSFQGIISIPIRIASCLAYGIYTSSDWPIYLACPFLSLIGLYFGDRLQKRVNRDQVAQALMLLVYLSALNLSGVTQGDAFGYIMLAAFILSFIAFVGSQIWHFTHPPAHWEISAEPALPLESTKVEDDRKDAVDSAA